MYTNVVIIFFIAALFLFRIHKFITRVFEHSPVSFQFNYLPLLVRYIGRFLYDKTFALLTPLFGLKRKSLI